MPCQLLVAATTHAKETKGEIIVVRDEPAVWGSMEGLPSHVIVRISNASAADVDQYLGRWKTAFEHSVSTLPNLDKQITVMISQKIVDLFGTIQGLRLAMKTYLEDQWFATVISYNATEAVFNVPADTNLALLKAEIADQFEQQFGHRYLFDPAEVDIAIGLGGFVDVTKAQAIARIIDRAV